MHSPSVLFTQKIAIWILPCTGSALFELVTRQTVCFQNYRTLGRASWGVGMDKPPCTYLLLAAQKKTISWQRDLFSFQSSPNKQNWQNETWETLATKESSLPRIKVNNSFVGFCFIFQAILPIKRNCGICRKPKHSHTLLTASAHSELHIRLPSTFKNND